MEILDIGSFDFYYESERQTELEHPFEMEINGQIYTVEADVMIDYTREAWYWDEYGTEYEWQFSDLWVTVITIWDEEGDKVEGLDEWQIAEVLADYLKTLK